MQMAKKSDTNVSDKSLERVGKNGGIKFRPTTYTIVLDSVIYIKIYTSKQMRRHHARNKSFPPILNVVVYFSRQFPKTLNGRKAMDERYFPIVENQGIRVDEAAVSDGTAAATLWLDSIWMTIIFEVNGRHSSLQALPFVRVKISSKHYRSRDLTRERIISAT